MKWMRERDLLIAQTVAFVQSVTGKKPDTDQFVGASGSKAPVIADPAMTNIEAVLAETAQPPRPSQPIQAARPEFPDDFRSEVKARIANFRAHQERFLKEREAYSSATMAKVRAALGKTEPPRFGK
jgi:hypothetical protein